MEEGGCSAWLLIIVTAAALAYYEGKRAFMALTPYWPDVERVGLVVLACGAALTLLWIVGYALWDAAEPWRLRRRALRQIAEAQAEIRAIRERTAWQMARGVRRQRRR